MNYLYHLDVVDGLKRELALARASSDYWRAKYIGTQQRRYSDSDQEFINKWNRILYGTRSPMDECDE